MSYDFLEPYLVGYVTALLCVLLDLFSNNGIYTYKTLSSQILGLVLALIFIITYEKMKNEKERK